MPTKALPVSKLPLIFSSKSQTGMFGRARRRICEEPSLATQKKKEALRHVMGQTKGPVMEETHENTKQCVLTE